MLGRPQPSEAAPYYFTYIDQVSGEDAQTVLANQLREFGAQFGEIAEERSLYRYAPEKWSFRQVLNHVTDTERGLAFRAFWFARGFTAALPSYDQNIAATAAHADQVAWSDHVEEFRRVRLATIALFANMPNEAWSRSGIASDLPFTVRALAFIIAGHAAHHVRILRQKYL